MTPGNTPGRTWTVSGSITVAKYSDLEKVELPPASALQGKGSSLEMLTLREPDLKNKEK